MTKHYIKSFYLLSAFLVVGFLIFISCGDNGNKTSITLNHQQVADPPSIRSYPSSAKEVNSWINNLDQEKIRQHSWDIWESITSKTEIGVPVWETWFSGDEVFNSSLKGSTRESYHHFEFPNQFAKTILKRKKKVPFAEIPTSFNRYSKSLADYIWEKQYNKKSVLTSINNSFNNNNTSIFNREISTSKDSVDVLSFALKPVFQFITKDSATAVPYWAGISPQSTTDLTNPEPHTWRQAVIIDPTGKLKPGTTHKMSCNGEPAREWPVVSLDDFYHIKLTEAEAKNFSQFALESGDNVGEGNMTDTTAILNLLKAGNYALLVAMHVTGKEIKNWTWQTFWWSPNNQDPIFGKDRPKTIAKPWSNYNMRTAYYMVSPPGTQQGGEPLISFNPYLETNLVGKVPYETIPGDSITWYGAFSNCMSCHRMAAYPNNYYISDGFINPADPKKFSGITKTDFLWSIPTRAE